MFNAWQKEWDGFTEGRWSHTSVNVRDFIKKNYTPYPVKTEKGIMYNQNHRTACNHIDYRLFFM